MKFKILWICLIIIVFSFPSICFSEKPDQNKWEQYGENSYYDKTNFTKLSNIISVWTYMIVTDDYRKKEIEILKERDFEKSKKYQNWDHYLVLWEIDCKKRQSKLKEFIDYDDKDNILYNKINNDIEWEKILPNSVFDKLYIKVCETQKVESPKVEIPNVESPKVETPNVETPKIESENVKPIIPDSKIWESVSPYLFYNKTNITKSSNTISVWSYRIVNDKFREENVERMKEIDIEKSKKYQNFDHSIYLFKMNCKKGLFIIKESTNYDAKGNILDHFDTKNSEFKSIPSESILEELYNKVCVTPKKTLKKK